MDDTRDKPPGGSGLGDTMPPPGDTLPNRPVVGSASGQDSSQPTVPGPGTGEVMPPPPAGTTPRPTADLTPARRRASQTMMLPAIADEPPSEASGLQREVANLNLDATAGADSDALPDRHSTEAVLSIVDGGTIPVEVNSIDRELIAVWKSTASGGDNEGKVAVTLMRAMNLIVYLEDDSRADEANAAIEHSIGRHPCRTIMVVNRSGTTTALPPARAGAADGDMDATLSAYCHAIDASGKRICCEQIAVAANSPAALGRVANVALNLLITDLPVFLWWAEGAPFNNSVLTQLEDSIDRLVVDSSGFTDPLAGLLALARSVDPAFRQPDSARYAPSDFNWSRIEGWCEATAQIFDQPKVLPSLWRIGSIEIEYVSSGAGRPNPVQALLYISWLATRLGWEFHGSNPAGARGGPGDVVITLRQGKRSIPVLVRAVQADAPEPGSLLSVHLTTNDVVPISFRIGYPGDGMFMDCSVQREGGEAVQSKARFNLPNEADLLDVAMELFGHDQTYEQALVLAGSIAWASLSIARRDEIASQLGTDSRKSSFDPRF